MQAVYDRWKQRHLVAEADRAERKGGKKKKEKKDKNPPGGQPGGATLYRIAAGAPGTDLHRVTFSEGQGWGLVIVALLAGYDPNAQAIFDGLWRYAQKHRSCIENRLMLWKIPNNAGDGCVDAFDGDADLAYGLLLADAQWGSGGAINYRAEARQVLAGLRAKVVGPTSNYPLPGDWVDPNGSPGNQFTTRTSDFMTSHFRAFARADDAVWQQVIQKTQSVVKTIQQNFSQTTGLLPEFVVAKSANDTSPVPVAANVAEEGTDCDTYGSNACRVPWRLGVDALLHGDQASFDATKKISEWIRTSTGGDPAKIRYGYQLDGTPLPNSNFYLNSFGAPFAVAAMTVPGQQAWLNALYDAVVASRADYYEDTIALICLIILAGNYWNVP